VCADRGTLGYDGHSAGLAAGGLARPKAERNGVGAGGGEGTASLTTVWRGNKDAVRRGPGIRREDGEHWFGSGRILKRCPEGTDGWWGERIRWRGHLTSY